MMPASRSIRRRTAGRRSQRTPRSAGHATTASHRPVSAIEQAPVSGRS
jgi:hypothetical protein